MAPSAGAGVRIRLLGASRVLRVLGKLGLRGRTMPRPLLEQIGTTVESSIKMNFVKGVDPMTGKKWPALTSRKGTPLRNRGHLMRSINKSVGSASVVVGTNHIGAKVQNYGAIIRPRKAKMLRFEVFGKTVFARKVVIPQRRFLPENPLPSKLQASIKARVTKYAKAAEKSA